MLRPRRSLCQNRGRSSADSSSSPRILLEHGRAPAATRWRPSVNSSSHCLPARPPGSHPHDEQDEGNASERWRPCDASHRGAAAARPAGWSQARALAAVAGPEATDPGAGSVARPARSAEHLSRRRDAFARALRAEGFLFHASVPRRRGPRPGRGRRAATTALSSRPVVEQLAARTLMVPTDARGRQNFSWDATGVLLVRGLSRRLFGAKEARDALARRTIHPCPQVLGWGDVHDGVIASCCPRLASAAPCSCASGP